MARSPGFRYSRWDGTQRGFDLDADALLEEMADDLLYHGDLNAALRRLMQQGMRDRDGEQLMGLREMLDKLRERRREELEKRDLGGVYDDVARQLDEVVDMERAGIDRRVDEAQRSGDPRRQELLEDVAELRKRELAELPPDLAGRVQALQQYEFMDDAARQRFEELMDELREQLMQSYFNQMSEGMQNLTPERMAAMKDMMAELNEMLEQRARGEEPDFEGFMDRHGEFFPGNPASLDELLEQMAQSMAQMQQLMNSMSPEQRAQLQALAESLMEDMDLRWQVDQLSRNLQQAFPNLPWQRSQQFGEGQPMGFGDCPACSTPSATSTRSNTSCVLRRSRASSRRSTSTGPASCSATTPRARSPSCASWPRRSRTPGSSSSARAGSSSRPAPSGPSATRRCPSSTAS
jgi:uncharacterized protein with von Willebrand factor type A (vWA) domain